MKREALFYICISIVLLTILIVGALQIPQFLEAFRDAPLDMSSEITSLSDQNVQSAVKHWPLHIPESAEYTDGKYMGFRDPVIWFSFRFKIPTSGDVRSLLKLDQNWKTQNSMTYLHKAIEYGHDASIPYSGCFGLDNDGIAEIYYYISPDGYANICFYALNM